jgi:hypothetical protein
MRFKMQDILTRLETLRRPRLLIRAARFGLEAYRRQPHLRRQLGAGPVPGSAQALVRMSEIEAELDAQRRCGGSGYCPARHVDVLIAMMGEARILRATRPDAVR